MFSQIARANDKVVEIKLSGRVSGRDYREICALLTEAINKRARLDLFCELDESFRGISLPVLWRAAFVASEGVIKLRRVAVVGERKGYKWARVMVRAFHGETRYFDRAHRTRALRWLEKGTVAAEVDQKQKLAGAAGYRTDPKHSPHSTRQGSNGRSNRKGSSKRNGL